MRLKDSLKNLDVYDALKRSLRRKKGFGLFFVIATPAQGKEIIQHLKEDFSHTTVEVLTLTEETPNLFDKIEVITQQKMIDYLVISGIEKSLDPYVKSSANTDDHNSGRGDYYKLNPEATPSLLSHLNLQRDRFKKTFNFPLVFLLSPFAYRFIIRRSPDFFDWRSGVFEFPIDSQEIEAIHLEANSFYFAGDYESAIKSLDKAIYIKPDDHEAWNNRGVALFNLGRYEEAIVSYDKAIEFKPDLHEAWNNRGSALGNLGRNEEAIVSYDKAIEFKPDDHEAWYNRGNALDDLGRYEEAIVSYDKAIEFKPDYHEAWHNRGSALGNLGRYEEAIVSYDKAIEFKPDYHEAWNNRGIALAYLKQYQEAMKSYQKALKINPSDASAYYNIACCYALQNKVNLAVENLRRAINLDEKYREMAKTDSDFDGIRGIMNYEL